MFLKFLISTSIITTNLLSYIIIEHVPIEYFVPNYRIKLSATMKDYYHNFTSAQLKFKSSSESGDKFYHVDMSCNSDNICSTVIPAPMKSTKRVVYSIIAKDRVGDIYKTQTFSVPQITLPTWQIDDIKPIQINSTSSIVQGVAIDGFSEKVQIKYLNKKNDNSKKIESKFQPPKEINMREPKTQRAEQNQIKGASIESIDLTGVWSIRRTLSTCTSGLYSHKVIKIESLNGIITESKSFKKGTKFFYSNKSGYVCQLIDDNLDGALVGESSIYTYQSFFESLKNSLDSGEFVKLIEFSKDKVIFELHLKTNTLTTIYKREQEVLFFR